MCLFVCRERARWRHSFWEVEQDDRCRRRAVTLNVRRRYWTAFPAPPTPRRSISRSTRNRYCWLSSTADAPLSSSHLRQGGYVFIGVCLSVSRITPQRSIDFHKIRWEGCTRATEKKPLDFDDNLARSRYVRDTATVRRGTSCIPCRCVYVNIAGPVKT